MRPIRVFALALGAAVLLIAVTACFLFTSPKASFTISPEGGRAPLRVAFDGSSSYDPNGEIEEHEWRFGDGATGSGETVEHTYETPGNYTAVLEVEDDGGTTDSASQVIRVTAAPGIFAEFVWAEGICTAGNAVCDESKAIGAPDAPLGQTTTGYHVSLGSGDGFIVAQMEQGFTNGDGPDLRVYEVGELQGGIDERFSVYVSANAVDWLPVATAVKNDSGRTYTSIDISQYSGVFRYVKISNRGEDVSSTPGADIDAIEALYGTNTPPEDQFLHGIDVNATQGADITWSDVHDAGYEFVYVKATSGDADEPALWNHDFRDQIDEAYEEELAAGVFHFAYAGYGNSATDEAAWFLEKAGDYIREGYLRPALDVEDADELPQDQRNSHLDTETLTNWVREWMEAVEALTEVEPILYVNSEFAKANLADGLVKDYDVWIADWDECDTPYPPDRSPDLQDICDDWAFWQYWAPKTSEKAGGCVGSRPVPGITEPVDLDVFNGGMAELEEYKIPPGVGWYPPDDSVVAYYDFDEAVDTTLLDHSRYFNFGDIQAIDSIVTGKIGKAFSLDGVDDWIKVPDSESLHNIGEMTVDCWVKPLGLPSEGKPASTGIAAFGKEQQGMWELRLMGDGAVYLLLNWNTAEETEVLSSAHLTIGAWYHVTATYDGSTARLYVDGELTGESACDILLYPGEGSFLAIGLDFPGLDEYFDGLIDELRIFSEVVSP